MIYRPDIKPPMWGLPEAVQHAVRRNAEQMGIDPASIVRFLPSWENGGANVYGWKGDAYTNAAGWDLEWDPFGFRTPGLNSNAFVDIGPTSIGKALTEYTLIMHVTVHQFSGIENGHLARCGGGASTNSQFFAIHNSSAQLWHRINSGGSLKDVFCNTIPEDRPASLAAYWTSAAIGARIDNNATSSEVAASGTIYQGSGSDSAGNRFLLGQDPWVLRRTTDNPNATYHSFLLLNKYNENAIGQLAETPYALLMPVSRPFIFDLAGGGSTETPGNALISITGLDPIIDITEIPNIDALIITGQDVTEVTSASEVPENASIVVTGLDVNTMISITESPGEAAMTIAGQDVNTAVLITEQVLNAALTLVGNDIILAERVIVNGATITINGRQVTVTGDEVINIIRQSGLSIGIRIGI